MKKQPAKRQPARERLTQERLTKDQPVEDQPTKDEPVEDRLAEDRLVLEKAYTTVHQGLAHLNRDVKEMGTVVLQLLATTVVVVFFLIANIGLEYYFWSHTQSAPQVIQTPVNPK